MTLYSEWEFLREPKWLPIAMPAAFFVGTLIGRAIMAAWLGV